MSDPLHEINRTLGEFMGALRAIEATQATLVADVKEIGAHNVRMQSRIDDHEDTIAGISPFVEKAKRWEQRGVGAGMVLTSLGMIFGGTLVAAKDKIFSTLGWS